MARDEFIGVVHNSTAKAVLFQDWFWHHPRWMPRGQITTMTDPDTHSEVKIKASNWICKAKGLHEFRENDEVDSFGT